VSDFFFPIYYGEIQRSPLPDFYIGARAAIAYITAYSASIANNLKSFGW
jgi:hypothetical protein